MCHDGRASAVYTVKASGLVNGLILAVGGGSQPDGVGDGRHDGHVVSSSWQVAHGASTKFRFS